ncbi:MAG TPA: FHA domain-containing protein [Longimicrobiales bacterium]|nr:FHA domain-containing protein [Longimicrobiales bacterium]
MEASIPTDLPGTPAPAALDVFVVLLGFAVVVLLVAAVRLLQIRLRDRREQNRDLPPLIYPVRQLDEHRASMAAARVTQPPSGEQVLFNSTAPLPSPMQIVREPAHESAGATDDPASEMPAADFAADLTHDAHDAHDAQAAHDADDSVTLQLLPGRLEPLERGMDQEIRFVRIPGVNRFTLGRNAGPEHSHIQLRARTASRMHAYMVYEDSRWLLGNMSQTNAVVLNGSPLNGDPHRLQEGDRIEFGELTFVFRER